MRASEGEIIACTDDDVIVPADWLTRIVAAFDGDPELGLLYGQVLVPDEPQGGGQGGHDRAHLVARHAPFDSTTAIATS